MKALPPMSKRKKAILAAVASVLLGVIGGAVWIGLSVAEEIVKFPVPCGTFVETLHVAGVIEAARFEELQAPEAPYERQLTWLVPEGTFVSKGDLIAQFDMADVENHWEGSKEHVETLTMRQESEKATWSIQLYEEDIKRDKQKEQKDLATLRVERSKQEPPLPKEIGTTEKTKQDRLVSDYDRRIGQFQRQSGMELRRRERWLEYRKGKTQEIYDAMSQYEIRAPLDSIVVYPLIPIRGAVKKAELGDYLNRRQPFVQLPDLNSLIIKVGLEEHRVQKVTENTPVRFTTRAFPNREFKGKVISVSRLAMDNLFHDGRKLFEVDVAIENATNLGLRVGMVVDVSLIVGTHENVYAFPRDYVQKKGNDEWLEVENANGKRERLPVEENNASEDYILIARQNRDGTPLTAIYRPSKAAGTTP